MADQPSLRVVRENETPLQPALEIVNFTFVRGKDCLLVYRNGRLLDLTTATDALVDLMREAVDKQRAMLNEMASTPGGIR